MWFHSQRTPNVQDTKSHNQIQWHAHFRLCHLHKHTDETYGFTLTNRDDIISSGHAVNFVKINSPSYMSGLRTDDRIIEINGCNVENENFRQIDSRIKAGLRTGSSCNCSSFCINADPLSKLPNKPVANIIDSISSNDSGIASDETSDHNNKNVSVNECLLLVLDQESYLIYKSNRSGFVSTAPVVYMKPINQNMNSLDLQVDLDELMHKDFNYEGSLIEQDFNSLNETSLFSSSNESFADIESFVEIHNNDIPEESNIELQTPLEISNNASPEMISLPSNPKFSPRLCHLRKIDGHLGYGFNLICPRNSKVQVIGKVESNSPASFAGLTNHDIVVEVNGVNVLTENHRQVVAKITDGVMRNGNRCKNEVILLVIDPEAKQWYDDRGIIINCKLPNILIMGEGYISEEIHDVDQETSFGKQDEFQINTGSSLNSSGRQTSLSACKSYIEVNVANTTNPKKEMESSSMGHISKPLVIPSAQQKEINQFGLYFNMTAAQMREIMRQRGGKRSNRCNNLTLREKYKIIQNM